MRAVPEYSLTFPLAREDVEAFEAEAFAPRAARARGVWRKSTEVWFDTGDSDLRAAGFSLSLVARGRRKFRRARLWPDVHVEAWPDQEIQGVIFTKTDLPEALRARVDIAKLKPLFQRRLQRCERLASVKRTVIVVAIERGEIIAGPVASPFLQARFELAIGRAADFFAYVREFAVRPNWRPDFATPAEAGVLRLRDDPDAPVGKIVPSLTSDMTAAEGFAGIAASCLRQYSFNAPLLGGPNCVEALHQARVALRRLRSAVTLFAPILRDGAIERLRSELKWLFGAFGPARDLDVLYDRLAAQAPASTLSVEALTQIEEQRAVARKQMLESVSSSRAALLLFDLAEWTASGEWRRSDDPRQTRDRLQSLGAFAARRLGKRRAAFRSLVEDIGELDETGLHELRIQTKKLRYAAEFVQPIAVDHKARGRCANTLAALAALQDTLGEIHDIDAPPEIAIASPVTGPNADLRARLVRRARHEAKAAARIKPFWSKLAGSD